MKFSLATNNMEVPEAERAQMNEKLTRLQKHLEPPFVVDVVLRRDAHHRQGDVISCRVTIEQGKRVFHVAREAGSIQTALDAVIEGLGRELGKHHEQKKQHRE